TAARTAVRTATVVTTAARTGTAVTTAARLRAGAGNKSVPVGGFRPVDRDLKHLKVPVDHNDIRSIFHLKG
ncbi:hypothetical protein, partial [Streptomyces sp. NPDC048551]|uniref:hypothetical protein n=1 Tax=Streptomyces sp. NPDC048551 TaxID=3155758 RepID=UPI0034417940